MSGGLTFPAMAPAQVRAFQCLGDACPDTCCQGWTMQVDALTQTKYAAEAPELLADLDTDTGADGTRTVTMRRDPATTQCVRLEGGWCGIHRARGAAWLGDACYFYPRLPRRLGAGEDAQWRVDGALSCPELARLALLDPECPPDAPLAPYDPGREATLARTYAPDGLDTAAIAQVHAACVTAVTAAEVPPALALRRLAGVAQSLARLPTAQWGEAIGFLLRTVDGRLPAPQPDAADPLRLLHTLALLINAAPHAVGRGRARLMAVVESMEQALGARVEWESGALMGRGTPPCIHAAAPLPDALVRRWLATQLGITLFPFGGLGADPLQRALILAVRFATVRLALAAHSAVIGAPLTDEDTIRIVQTLARFLDHLADPALSLALYTDAGWAAEARLHGLIG